VTLPAPIAMLSNEWIIGVSLALFVLEFFADKVRYSIVLERASDVHQSPGGALLAWSATTSLSPAGQMTVAVPARDRTGAHGGKLALRSA
jgi:hypothetical protein